VTTWRAPGRVNLIGEHTDYNDGLVLPIALDLGVTATVTSHAEQVIRIRSDAYPDTVEVPLDGLAPGSVTGWPAYVAGVVWSLRDRGHELPGLEVHLASDLPVGAGLSSSAALDCSVLAAVDDLLGLGLSRADLIDVAHRADNVFVGVPSGTLDQSASLLCEQGHALLLDVRTGERRQVPFDLRAWGLALLVVDTNAPHAHADGEYATRRNQCEQAAAALGVTSLRDVQDADAVSDPLLRRRTRHVVSENARVLELVQVLDSGRDPRCCGEVLLASHASLRDDYEVSCPELDLAVDVCVAEGAHGARMTGGGFGGSAIALVDEADVPRVTEALLSAFSAAGWTAPDVFAVTAAAGAHRL
jgi:galactokinase